VDTCVRKAVILTIIIWQYAVSFTYGNPQSKPVFSVLPWAVITETAIAENQFCMHTDSNDDVSPHKKSSTLPNLDSEGNYAFKLNQSLSIRLTGDMDVDNIPQPIEIDVAKYTRNSWQDKGKVITNLEQARIRIPDGIDEEGFFKLSFDVKQKNGELSSAQQIYAIISNDWKKDILAFLQKLKYAVESNPNTELFRSSIAVSHVDYTLEMVGQTSVLSGKVLKALADMVVAQKTVNMGQCPDLVTCALNKIRIKRFAGAQIAEFVVYIPAGYTDSVKWPVYIRIDPLRMSLGKYGLQDQFGRYEYHERMIDLWWHTISPNNLFWEEYKLLKKILKQKLNINEDSVFLYGYCGNAPSAMSLALHHPDEWAGVDVFLGNSYNNLAGNAFNLNLDFKPLPHPDAKSLEASYAFATKSFRYRGCNLNKNRTLENQRLQETLPCPVRKLNPEKVLFTADSPKTAKAYWVTIDGRIDENFVGTIDVSVTGQTIFVKTSNIDAYTLDLAQAPVDSDAPVDIIENNESLGYVVGNSFVKRSEKYADATYIKNERISGPIWDAFATPYVVVWGTQSDNPEFIKNSQTIANFLANGAPIFSDVSLPKELILTHNLILIGTDISNTWLAKVSKQLPVQIRADKLIAGGKCYEGHDIGFMLIYPNPINPKKYIAVFSATSPKAMAGLTKAYSELKSQLSADVGIFEITENGTFRWRTIENFNTVWNWHKEWDQPLVTIEKEHPRRQWCQFIAKAMRKQLNADVSVCGDPFRFSYCTLKGQITYRDLFNAFRNDWIVKIRLDGKSLKKGLRAPLDITLQKVFDGLIFDGVTFIAPEGNPKEKLLGINEIADDKKYTMVFSHEVFSSKDLGSIPESSEIAADDYLVPLLKNYLLKNNNLEIDTQLDNLKLNLF